jgi:ABC-type dipeptide/oligopeptide/nickel transport system permease subunit
MSNRSRNAAPVDATAFSETPPGYSETRRIISIFFGRPLPVIGLVLIIIVVIAAIFAPLLAPYDPYKLDIVHKLQSY